LFVYFVLPFSFLVLLFEFVLLFASFSRGARMSGVVVGVVRSGTVVCTGVVVSQVCIVKKLLEHFTSKGGSRERERGVGKMDRGKGERRGREARLSSPLPADTIMAVIY
jgi:hypothetical protein